MGGDGGIGSMSDDAKYAAMQCGVESECGDGMRLRLWDLMKGLNVCGNTISLIRQLALRLELLMWVSFVS